MNIIYVDDERSAHVNFYYDLKDRPEIHSTAFFFTAQEALDYAQSHSIDCAFLDINLGDAYGGLALTEQLKAIHPNLEVAFVTGYDEFTKDSYRVGGRAYLIKPYTQEELNAAIALMKKLTIVHQKEETPTQPPQAHVRIRTFGYFDVLVDNIPVACKNAKAKELLAYLVNQRGGSVNGSQIFLALWEDQRYSTATSTYVRRTVRALKEELDTLGIGDIFVSKRNCYSVDPSQFVCDYYQLMAGNIEAAEKYNEEYMSQYSWGESTIPLIERKIASLLAGSAK